MPFFFLPSNRGPLPDFVQVRHKLKEMSDRIRQLEDALEILQKTNSSPSLTERLRGLIVAAIIYYRPPSGRKLCMEKYR